MGHPDFRVNNGIFATLHHDPEFGMVALTPDQQEQFMRDYPPVRARKRGMGAGRIDEGAVSFRDEETLGDALTIAWQNAVNKGASRPTRKRPARAARRSGKR